MMEGKWPSLSSLDRRICSLFFYWSTWNVFLGAMLGGSAFSQLGIVINNPSVIPRIIGTALPASSNFFINYVIIQASSLCPPRPDLPMALNPGVLRTGDARYCKEGIHIWKAFGNV